MMKKSLIYSSSVVVELSKFIVYMEEENPTGLSIEPLNNGMNVCSFPLTAEKLLLAELDWEEINSTFGTQWNDEKFRELSVEELALAYKDAIGYYGVNVLIDSNDSCSYETKGSFIEFLKVKKIV